MRILETVDMSGPIVDVSTVATALLGVIFLMMAFCAVRGLLMTNSPTRSEKQGGTSKRAEAAAGEGDKPARAKAKKKGAC